MEINFWAKQVICGDCIEIMNQMTAESVGCIVTSPPYNLRNSTGNGMKDGRNSFFVKASRPDGLRNGYDNHEDAMPHEDYVQWQRNCLSAMMRVLSNDGAIFYNHKWRVQGGLLQDRSDIVKDFPVRQIIIWKRDGGFNFNPGYFVPTYEVIYLICKPNFKLSPKSNSYGDLWHITSEKKNPHPAPFPLELADRCIRSTNAQVILDPFMGSGTTAIAAENNGRDWIGIDISQKYCEMAEDRISKLRLAEAVL